LKKETKTQPVRTTRNATVLITGGTGSFGNAMIDRLLREPYKEIRVFSRDEKKQFDMRQRYADFPVKFIIGDVRDASSVASAMHGVDLVFHAAALKQVPTAESFPLEAVKTNILGSVNVLEAAIAHEVKSVVCLSTDKAVLPANAMGMTKALMEKIVLSKARSKTDCKTEICTVRFGNVMCSRGSVIPVFIDQISNNQPITVTDPSMTRFMLTLTNAVDLILFALKEGRAGDTFVSKAPACTVDQLARCLMQILNKTVPIQNTGIRFGEKIDETLVSANEMVHSEDHGDYIRVVFDPNESSVSKGVTRRLPRQDYTSRNTHQLSDGELKKLLLTLPEVREAIHDSIRRAA
jgi:UDP-N-acetylglucosamine 4,6-dehydratase/5-epimerase